MYKLLLCTRYLRTRYIALASIISVMLGVATMIVVNSVMSGFASEMRERINGILADVVIETISLNGQANAEAQKELVLRVTGDWVKSVTASVEVFGLLHFRRAGQWIPRPITIIGIDPETEAQVCPLVHNLDSYREIIENDKLVRPALRSIDEIPSWELTAEALAYRREWKGRQRKFFERWQADPESPLNDPSHERLMPDEPFFESEAPPFFDNEPSEDLAAQPTDDAIDAAEEIVRVASERPAENPFSEDVVPAEMLQDNGPRLFESADIDAPLPGRLYIGSLLIEILRQDPRTGETHIERMVHPGDDVKISTVSAGSPPEPRHFFATVVDVYKSGMSEYDGNLVFCNLEYLQQMRGMIDPQSKTGAITTLKIRLNDYDDAPEVVQALRKVFPPHLFTVSTWEQKQGPLLAAVDIEAAILNVLLFLIIAVAGFGILAIFYMIVVEKTRDIGILKSLGASSRGVMSIFLTYGLALGVVGSGVGVALGLVFVRYINEIEGVLAFIIGRKVFDERIYYFPTIPTQVNAFTVTWVALGAIVIAVLASVLPARRAARLHPVQALRYE
jgi:lipoprotein-releasing system permease protein